MILDYLESGLKKPKFDHKSYKETTLTKLNPTSKVDNKNRHETSISQLESDFIRTKVDHKNRDETTSARLKSSLKRTKVNHKKIVKWLQLD